MIRKPTEEDFREGTAVKVARAAGKVTVQGGKGAGSALLRVYLIMTIAPFVIFLPVALLFAGPFGWLLMIGGAAAISVFFRGRKFAVVKQHAAEKLDQRLAVDSAAVSALAECRGAASQARTGRLEFDIAAISKQAVLMGLPGAFLLLFNLSVLLRDITAGRMDGFSIPFTLMVSLAIVLSVTAVLLLARLFDDHTAVEFDAESITVTGLLGKKRILWSDVETIHARKFFFFNFEVLLSIGARRAVVVASGGSRLLIPVRLLGFNNDEEAALVARLLSQWNRSYEMPEPAPSFTRSQENFTVDPRASFNTSAIKTHQMVEREQVVAVNRPDLVPSRSSGQRAFGRKTA